jgi:hypothetical protein
MRFESGDQTGPPDDFFPLVSRYRSPVAVTAIQICETKSFSSQFACVTDYATYLPSGEISAPETDCVESD